MIAEIETVPEWTSPGEVAELAAEHGTPNYFYSEAALREQAGEAGQLGAPFGSTVRFAMKANPHPELLRIFRDEGLHIDASSGAEAEAAMAAGFAPEQILITAQMMPSNLSELVKRGVLFNATSLHQLRTYGELFPGSEVSVRINPDKGDGGTKRTTTGGPDSSFGIWHEYIPEVHEAARQFGLTINRVHTHIGSGTDPQKWQEAATQSLTIVEQFPDATIMNLGGGFKVGRMSGEPSADIAVIGEHLEHLLKEFAGRTGRELHLEIEPGTFLAASAGMLVGEVVDKKDTGQSGHIFLVVNTGMKDLLRPSMYGAEHPLTIVHRDGSLPDETESVVVAGPNCESGDILTPTPGDPELLAPRLLGMAAIGDLIVVGGAGAYGRTMAPGSYNSHPVAGEIII